MTTTSRREEVLLEKLRAATLALRDTLDERDALLQARSEPIAIVGMGCRFPGGADDPDAFWGLLADGRDGVSALARRWAEVGERAPADAPRWAGLLTSAIDEFDPGFFGISPREAATLDPQQRLLLEVGWEALEDAGIPPHVLKDSRTGVYIGATNTDYAGLLARAPGADQDAYAITGNLLSVAAGRLAYTWGLQGPCMTIDTVCSSSLVTVHLACQSLRAGECGLALAGGVNLILSAAAMAGVQRTQALAPDGRCKTFDALANGFARGEGCGIVVLKRMGDAVRDGDRVWAVIRGSAINQDGASTGLTAPNVRAQAAMLRAALANAGVAADQVGFVETHGTGTSLGDPIEVEALREVLGAPRADGSRCLLGAVKTNLGHLEAAAGIAGLIKAALVLRNGVVPRNLNFRGINPRIRIEGTALALASEASEWPPGPRIAGVSAFGLSGTNAHVILADVATSEAAAAPVRAAELFVVSARTADGLAAACGRLVGHAAEAGLGDLARSLACSRSPLEWRAAVVATSRAELDAALAGLARGEAPAPAQRGALPRTRGGLAFLFTGQGAQVAGMGQGLHAAWPAFRAAFDECAGLFDEVLPRRLTEVMWGAEAGLIDRTEYTQPALFCLQVGLVALWRSWGVEPGLLAGHSVGELAAAWAAGVFGLADAVKLVAARGRLMGALPAGGAMVTIAADEAAVRAAIGGAAAVAVAAINGPAHTVIAGAEAGVLAIAGEFAGRGVKTRRLAVSHAFHSPLVEPMLAAFERVAAEVVYAAPTRALVANVTGALAGAEVATPGYWVRHAREAVRFADGVRALWAAGARTFVELGPRPALLASVPECVVGEPRLVASLRAGRGESSAMLAALAGVWLEGHDIDWRGVFPDGGRRAQLPHYPWQRRRCWFEAATGEVVAAAEPEVGAYYDELAHGDVLADGRGELDGGERYLTFAPFAAPVPGFSWLLATVDPTGHPDQARRVIAAQREMRAVLLRDVAFTQCRRVLDIGCGYGTDLVVLAGRHPHLELHGHTVSAEQVRLATQRADRAGVAERVTVVRRDSAQGPWMADYDLVFGVEVACHVRDKAALFAQAGAHLRADGWLVLSDFVAETSSDIEHAEAGSFLATAERWAEVLTRGGLRLSVVVDVSPEIANFLEDPEFAANLARLRGAGAGVVDAALHSYDRLGHLLRERLASYVLMTARKAEAGVDDAALLADNMRALTRRSAYAAVRGAADDGVFLEVVWSAAARPTRRDEPRRWLVVGGGALGGRVQRRLAALGHAVAADVPVMDAFAGAAPTDVVHLGSLEAAAGPGPAAFATALARGADDVLATLHGLTRGRWRDPPRLWLVTRGAQATVAGEDVDPHQAPVIGLGRVIAAEHPELRCVRVDLAGGELGRDDADDEVAALVDELLGDDAEDEVALRAGGRRVARLVRHAAPTVAARLAVDGTYLITGGLGGLGLAVAGWLADQGVRRLVLVGRQGAASADQQAAVAALVERGVSVTVARADVGERADVERVLAEIRASGSRLRGVVHAAGAADPALLADLTPARLRGQLAAKARGALLLDALTREEDLACFVMFASVAGLLGLAGTGGYAAANAVLDALAHHRRARGLAALSVDWGVFTGVGLATRAGERAAAAYTAGMRGMTAADGFAALGRLLGGDRAQVGVVPFDAAQWVESHPAAAGSRRLAPLLASAVTAARAGGELRGRVAAADPGARAGVLLAALRRHAAEVLRIPFESFDVAAPLTELGMDSLMGLELRNRVEVALALKAPPTLLWTYPTVAALADHLLAELGGGADDDDDDDAAALIDAEFEALA